MALAQPPPLTAVVSHGIQALAETTKAKNATSQPGRRRRVMIATLVACRTSRRSPHAAWPRETRDRHGACVTTRCPRLRRACDRHGACVTTRCPRLRRACDRHGACVTTRCPRLRRACDRHGASVTTRCPRLRRACDRHGASEDRLNMTPVWSVAAANRPYGVSSADRTTAPPLSPITRSVLSTSSAPKKVVQFDDTSSGRKLEPSITPSNCWYPNHAVV